jgi:general secretion pathway protein E
VASTTTQAAIFNTGVALTRPTETFIDAPESIAAAIDRLYLLQEDSHSTSLQDTPQVVVSGSSDVERDLTNAISETEQDLLSTQGKAPAVRLVDLILFEALLKDASDIHIQPVRGKTLIRYRMDGALYTVRELPGGMAAALVSRIKVMAQLNVAEHRAPQDGRASVTIGSNGGGGGGGGEGGEKGGGGDGGDGGNEGQKSSQGRRVDLRISTLPSTYGERVVIRLLDPTKSPHVLSFQALGMPADIERPYLAQASRPNGIVLVTGPTGSGKTTTLYTTLAWISSSNTKPPLHHPPLPHLTPHPHPTRQPAPRTSTPDRPSGCELNMMTVEDPVEYDLSGAGLAVSQTQVDAKRGVTFSTGLRHILRQDPDVIMVGEVRDEETARIAVQASLTGHLVLSTLHTNDAPSAIARLIDLGVEPFLVSSSLSAVLAQRLVRRVHRHCGGAGCETCLHSGYRGRTGVFELLICDQPMRELLQTRCSTGEISSLAIQSGMRTLKQHGDALVAEGLTTIHEVARVIAASEEITT